MITVLLATLIPAMNFSLCSCYAYDSEQARNPLWPDASPVYSSYYNDVEDLLYIYGVGNSNVVTVKIMFEGRVALLDYVQPENLPAVYDFSNSKGGEYQVIIIADDTILVSFSFYKD